MTVRTRQKVWWNIRVVGVLENGGWRLGLESRSMMNPVNSDPKHFPNHGSVTFHTDPSSAIQIIGLMTNSAVRDRRRRREAI